MAKPCAKNASYGLSACMCGMPHGSRYMVALDSILEFLTGDEVSGRHWDGDLIGDFKIGAFPIKIRCGSSSPCYVAVSSITDLCD